ncbi:MAG: O-antigen ligase family protein [Micavibrio aeruginosavorus]|uniref:O-antigen ligase family protein n=1 Tax=Micavibrio aeruginosavorus TaxID=349221 RepID=A0A7T5R479_9BACT|nr:MAG: O-antigen ligase family protein [Micavibrio aeruginosavorus]
MSAPPLHRLRIASQDWIYALPALLLGIALQIQITLFETDTYLGLRINAADLLLPVLGCLITGRLLLKRDPWPQWQIPYTYGWIAALTALVSLALVNGYLNTGHWNQWALINKYVGWFVLLAYMGVGAWLSGQERCDWKKAIFVSFAGFWAATMPLFLFYMIHVDLGDNSHRIYNLYPLEGLMANRNAYAFLSFCALAFLTAVTMKKPAPAPIYFHALWAAIPLFYIYNASRAGLVALIFIVMAFLATNLKWSLRHILLPLMLGAALTTAYTFWHKDSLALDITFSRVHETAQLSMLSQMPATDVQEKLNYDGDQVRIDTYSDALAVWHAHPIWGGGLGAFRDYQESKRGTYSDVIDFTALWLLAETGIIGLTLFAVFFALALWNLFARIRKRKDPDGFYLGALMIMLVFAIMSLTHELLYTRFLWFFMGMALALPAAERQS